MRGENRPGRAEEMESAAGLMAELPEAGTQLQSLLLVLREGQVAVAAELKVGPFLVDLLLDALDEPLDLLVFNVRLDDPARADGLGVPVRLCAPSEVVVSGSNLWVGRLEKLVFGRGVTPRNGLSFDGLVAGCLDGEGTLFQDARVEDRVFRHAGLG